MDIDFTPRLSNIMALFVLPTLDLVQSVSNG